MNKARLCVTALFAASQIILPAASVFAQTKEPDINPQFQQEMQSGASAPSAAPAASPAAASAGDTGEVKMPVATTPGVPLESATAGENGNAAAQQTLYDESESRSPMDTKVSVRLKDAPLTAFLDAISAQARISFIVAEGTQEKKITAFLRQISVREALQILLQINGLTYQRIGKSNTYVVMKRSGKALNLVTKIYTLSFISLLGVQSQSQAMSSITATTSVTSGFSNGSSGSASSGGGGGGGGDSNVPIINVLRSVLSAHGRITTEPRTNSLIIMDVPESFPQIEDILANLDRKAPQILIETQIVEIDTTRINNLGIAWGSSDGTMAQFIGPVRDTNYFLRDGFFSGNNWTQLFTSDDAIVTPGTFSLAQLTATLRALVSRDEARFLGKPKVVALNNTTSIVTILRDAVTSVTSTTTSSSTTSTVERSNVGVTLLVTPQVNKDGYITLLMQPSYSDVEAGALTDANGQTIYDPVSRGVSTLVRVKNGQTVVLGGLLQSKDEEVVRKVPLLGYIPIVGWLFTSSEHTRANTDLVLFVTPTILVD
jgi:type II secretory pathway component GspD/PulD (secretin)